MSGLWQQLGFSENPYFTSPIELSKSGLDLFVGRAVEVRRLVAKWDEKEGAITVIGGNIGTGKSSFLNVCQYLCMTGSRDFQLAHEPPLLVPAFTKVQLEANLSDANLLLRVIRAAINSIKRTGEFLGKSHPQSLVDVQQWLDSVDTSGEFVADGGIGQERLRNILGNHSNIPFGVMADKLEELAKSVNELGGHRGIIIALDNIELVEPSLVIELMNKYRDTIFATKGIWWVLIGQLGLYDLIDAEAPRVAQRIKGTETSLKGLSWEDFNLAIQIRIEQFRIRPNAVPPIGEPLLKQLFDASNGEIRYVFKMADEIVTDAIAEDPTLQNVPPEMAIAMLKQSVNNQISRLNLSEREKRVIKILCDKKSARPKDYKEYSFQNPPNFIQAVLQPLQQKGLIGRSTQGNAAVYSPRSLAILASNFAAFR